MSLTVAAAKNVVEVVARDPVCRAVIDPPDSFKFLGRLHIAGSTRNVALILAGVDMQKDSLAVRVKCTGIVERTTWAISLARVKGSVPGIRSSHGKHRICWGVHHDGTLVNMMDGTSYVFDWFPTLDRTNPIIYHEKAWLEDEGGVEFRDFAGFS